MLILLVTISMIALLFGLIQWARSGTVLWTIFSLKKKEKIIRSTSVLTKTKINDAIRDAESLTDDLLQLSFRVLGILALAMWIFLTITIILDFMGINWMRRVSSRAITFWESRVTHEQKMPKHDDVIKSIRNSFNK